jgi:hypothetical protein
MKNKLENKKELLKILVNNIEKAKCLLKIYDTYYVDQNFSFSEEQIKSIKDLSISIKKNRKNINKIIKKL